MSLTLGQKADLDGLGGSTGTAAENLSASIGQAKSVLSGRRRLNLLIFVLVIFALTMLSAVIGILFLRAFEAEESRLSEIARSQAELIGAVARFDAVHSRDAHPQGAVMATVSQIADAQGHYKGIGLSGEVLLGKREGENTVSLLPPRFRDPNGGIADPFDSELAGPLQQALNGQSGTTTSSDYRGNTVLVAFEPVEELGLGMVVKIDTAEIRAPFVRTAILASVATLLLITIGILLFRRISLPVIQGWERELEQRRSAEEALRASEARLIQAQHIARIGYWEIDIASGKSTWSAELLDMYGLLDAELVEGDRSVGMSFVHPEDRDAVEAAFQATLEHGETPELDFRIIRPDGEERIIHAWSGETLTDDRGEVIKAITALQDVTEERHAQEQLRLSEERLTQAQHIAGIGYWEIDTVSGKSTWSAGLLDMYGLSEAQAEAVESDRSVGMSFVHPEDRDAVEAAFQAKLEHGETPELDFRIIRPDGEERIIHSWPGEPLTDDRGEAIKAITAFQDVTEERHAQEQLRLSEERLSQAQQIAGIGYWEFDAGSGKSTWSSELLDMFGLSDREQVESDRMVGMSLIHPEDRSAVEKTFQTSLEQGERPEIEFRIVRPDGEERVIHSWPGGGRTDAQRELIPVITAFQDVTEERHAQEQLRQAQRMEAIGQLTGGVAHDFNNLLAVLMGNLELALRNVPDDSEFRPLLTSAMRAAKRGSALTRHLLAFSRRQTLAPQPTDINELTERVLQLAKRTLGEQIQIVFDPLKNLWHSNIDAAGLENALLNLALNARDAMLEGGILTIRTRNFTRTDESAGASNAFDAGDYVVVEVEDSGTGMSEQVLEKAFEPFFTTKGSSQGSGLGLSMVYGFVKQSGGQIDVDSVPGKGTTIRLYLPRSSEVIAPSHEAQDREPGVEGKGKTVLIVEDDPDVREIAVALVEGLGYTVLHTGDAESALELLKGGTSVDLVLSDIVLGKRMNGVELTHRIRESFPNTKTLLMSGYAHDTFAQDGGFDDADGIVGKPFIIADLAAKISSLLH